MSRVVRSTLRQQVYEAIRDDITRADDPDGRLPSLRVLADTLGTSFSTVKAAVAQLEAEGYVERRHGAGTFIREPHRPITLAQTVMLCIENLGHVWGDMCRSLANELQSRGRLPGMMDQRHADIPEAIRRAARGGVRTFIAHAGLHFPSAVFARDSALKDATVIATAEWANKSDFPGLYRVLTDMAAGGRIVADHLHELGHENALMVASPVTARLYYDKHPAGIDLPTGFVDQWEAHGGRWQLIESVPSDPEYVALDDEKVLDILTSADAPTAVFGLRDLEARLTHDLIRERLPERSGRIALVGYYDTPWSRQMTPRMSTVNIDVPQIVGGVMEIYDALQAGREPAQRVIQVCPRLVVGGTSRRRGDP